MILVDPDMPPIVPTVMGLGSIGWEDITNSFGERQRSLGGSALHFAIAASLKAQVKLVGAVGGDLPVEDLIGILGPNVDTRGIVAWPGERSFEWRAKYNSTGDERQTLETKLNVVSKHPPQIPAAFRDTRFVLAGNYSPEVQGFWLDSLVGKPFVLLNTMDYWIAESRSQLRDILGRVDGLQVNEEEALSLTGASALKSAIPRIHQMGPGLVIITLGSRGAIASLRGEIESVASAVVRARDPSGAGDAFAGGFLSMWASLHSKERKLRDSLAWGSVMASFAVEDFGISGGQRATLPVADMRFRTVVDATRPA